MKHHLRHMAIGGGAILVVLLLLKVDLQTALRYAVLLACPVGMVVMMVVMGRQTNGHGHDERTHEPAALPDNHDRDH